MKTIRKYRRMVEWVLVLLYLLLPFLKVGGESALRFDVGTFKFHFFGAALWMQEFYFLLPAAILCVALFLFLTLVFGRVWCGWLCPQTVWCDLTRFINTKKSNKLLGHAVLILISLLVGFITVCYFISPYEAIPQALAIKLGRVPTISTLILAFLFYVNIAFLRRNFCATICPYAKIQSTLTDKRSLLIHMTPERAEECIDCKMCVKACPTGVDIREGMQVACIMCAECVDACNKVMGRKDKKGLINYSFGKGGVDSTAKLIRPAAMILAAVSLLAFAAMIYQGSSRTSFDYSILPHSMMPRDTKEGGIINAYILSIKNKSDKDMSLDLSFTDPKQQESFTHSVTESMMVPAGQADKFPLFVRSKGKPAVDLKLDIILIDKSNSKSRLQKQVYFNLP